MSTYADLLARIDAGDAVVIDGVELSMSRNRWRLRP
jgi:hypothetical protein